MAFGIAPGFGAVVALHGCCGLAFRCLFNAVDGDKQDLEAKGNFCPVREGFLPLSLAATSGAGTGSLLPLTKSFPGHLPCSAGAQADGRAPALAPPSLSHHASSILSRLSQGLTK